jgi:DNA-directed RNA polymerase specialized sigma subunit
MYDAGLSVDYTKPKVQEQRGDKTASIAVKVADMDRKISDDIKRALNLMSEIVLVIDAVQNPLFRSILSLRYINNLKFSEIQEILEISDKTKLSRLHGQALMEIKKEGLI